MPQFQFRPRLTIRRLMVAVAILGLAFGIWSAMVAGIERQRRINDLILYHQNKAFDLTGSQIKIISSKDYILFRKYQRAARYPWLPVEPEPPEPE